MDILSRMKVLLGRGPTCEDVNGFILCYLEGVLDKKTAKQFEMHVGMCANCARYLDSYRTTVRVVKGAGEIDPPPELLELTLAFLHDRWGTPDDGRSLDQP